MNKVALGLLVFFIGADLAGAESLTIARAGKTDAVILLQNNPDQNLVVAAEDLAEYLEKMTGATIPIVTLLPAQEGDALKYFSGPILSVGETIPAGRTQEAEKWERLKHREAYRVKRSGRMITIMGNSWGDDAQEGARHGVYSFLEHLGVRWFIPGELGERYPKMKDLTIDELDLSGQPTMGWRGAFNYGAGENNKKSWARRNHLGGYNLECAHNWGHTDESPLTPWKKYTEEHPDWFMKDVTPTAPCLSNPGVRARFIEAALQAFKNNPKRYSWSLTGPDWPEYPFCPCPRCKPLQDISISDLMQDFWNSITAEVTAKYPDKFCAALPYTNYLPPPKKIKPHPNFIPVLAPLGMREESPKFIEIAEGWSALSDKVHMYHFDLGEQSKPRKIGSYFANYRKWNIKGTLVERRPTWAISGLNYWLETRLMWDWNAYPEKLVDEFCLGLFGPKAGPVMKEFFYTVEQGNTWNQRKALIDKAAGLLSDQPDSKEAQCVRIFQLGETMLRCRALMQEAANRKEFQAAADLAAEGIKVYEELRGKPIYQDLYYREAGDSAGSPPHQKLLEMEPIYRAEAAKSKS